VRTPFVLNTDAGIAQLLTEYANTHPAGLTIINTGLSTVYLGDDPHTDDSNGLPLAPGMSIVWGTSPALYAYGNSTVLLTDNAGNPQPVNLVKPVDTWNLPSTPAPNGTTVVSLSQDNPGAYTSGGVYVVATLATWATLSTGPTDLNAKLRGHFYALTPTGLVIPLLSTDAMHQAGATTAPPYKNANELIYSGSASGAALPAGGNYSINFAIDHWPTGETATNLDLQILTTGFALIPT
jgi:hypothetical protein